MDRLIIVAVVVLAAAISIFFILGNNESSYQPTPSQTEAEMPQGETETPAILDLPLRTTGAPRTYTVLMRNEGGRFFFDPAALRVLPGDTVVWFNLGSNHSATAYAPPNVKAGGVGVPLRIPEGAAPWDSGILGIQDRGLTFSYTFTVAGTYDYYCFPHEFLGMVGRIVVDAPGGPGETDDFGNISDESIKQLNALPSAAIVSSAGTSYNWAAEINTVLLKGFEKDDAAAVSQAQQLIDQANQITPLLGADAAQFETLLREYLELAQTQAGFGPVSEKGDALKALLANARR